MTEDERIAASLFETDFRIHIKKSAQKGALVSDKATINYNMELRVDSRDFDKVMGYLAPIAKLKNHNIQSREDWIESILENVKSKLTFELSFKDHMATFRIPGGKNIASFSNVELTTFQFEPQHSNITFHLIAYGVNGETVGKMVDAIHANLQVTFKRAAHWSVQESIPSDDETEEDGDADRQQSLPEGDE